MTKRADEFNPKARSWNAKTLKQEMQDSAKAMETLDRRITLLKHHIEPPARPLFQDINNLHDLESLRQVIDHYRNWTERDANLANRHLRTAQGIIERNDNGIKPARHNPTPVWLPPKERKMHGEYVKAAEQTSFIAEEERQRLKSAVERYKQIEGELDEFLPKKMRQDARCAPKVLAKEQERIAALRGYLEKLKRLHHSIA